MFDVALLQSSQRLKMTSDIFIHIIKVYHWSSYVGFHAYYLKIIHMSYKLILCKYDEYMKFHKFYTCIKLLVL